MTTSDDGLTVRNSTSSELEFKPLLSKNIYIVALVLLILIPSVTSAPYILSDTKNPSGTLAFPEEVTMESEGFLMIILDGVGREKLLDQEQFSRLHATMRDAAVLEVETGPLTLSATCISELMTGVPNSPVDGLNNFNLGHPGGTDPWTLSQEDPRYSVGLVGSYVMGNLFDQRTEIEFIDTFKGHGDFYEGDIDTEARLSQWLGDDTHNVIAAHFSGPDKVGHKWGTESEEYRAKMLDMDLMLKRVLHRVPDTWTVMVTADHGMTASGSHGSAEQITRQVAALVSGPDISKSSSTAMHQRDLPALMVSALGLPFPVQLHGQIPLQVFSMPTSEKLVLQQWNWNAAVQRNNFYHDEYGSQGEFLSQEDIDWSQIAQESTFTRNSDQYLAVAAWSAIVLLSIASCGKQAFSKPKFKTEYALFIGVICASLWSHINLSAYPMIPRFLGGIFVVALVAWPLLPARSNPSESKSPGGVFIGKHLPFSAFSSYRLWAIFTVAALLLFQDISKAIAYTSLLWMATASIETLGRRPSMPETQRSEFTPILLALVAISFASLRLWFALIPLFFWTTKEAYGAWKENGKGGAFISMLSLSALLFVALTTVHRRIFSRHWMLEFVRYGWPDSIGSWGFSLLAIVVAATVCTLALNQKMHLKRWVQTFGWLMLSLGVQASGKSEVDLLFLGASIALYWWFRRNPQWRKDSVLRRQSASTLLAGFVLLTWGAWSAMSTLILLSALPELIKRVNKGNGLERNLLSHPRAYIALAVLPWAVWILWWTSLGQVNGLQTCMEGICPHPRELDPGAVMVRGGYIGSRVNPATPWMVLMIVSPLLLCSVALLNEFSEQHLSLRPYVLGQVLLIMGCLNMYAFSAEYPRLIFSLTWSIMFAGFQITAALIVMQLQSNGPSKVFRALVGLKPSSSEASTEPSMPILV